MTPKGNKMAEKKYKSPKTANNPTPLEALMMLRNNVHSALDVGGMVPGVGAVPDLLNAGIYASEGDKLNTGLSLAAATPLVGLSAGASKLFKQIYDKMTRHGVEGLSRTESSFIKRNFDEYKDFVGSRRDLEDSWRDTSYDLDYPDESMSVYEQRFWDDDGLQKLHKTMKKSSKGNFSKGTGELNKELSKHGGGTYGTGSLSPRQQEAMAKSLLKENPNFWKDPGFAEYYPELAKIGKALSDDVPF